MSNFGLYAGEDNFLDFTSTESSRPIVLIGGANGRGKTTILEAILLCLYGSRSYAFLESSPLTFSQYITKFINRTNRNKTINLELNISTFFEGKKSNIVVKRDWEETEKGLKSSFEVFRDSVFDRLLTDDWDNQIEHIMPVGLSKFFLFDGERVAELMRDDSDSKIADSIKVLFGLDAIDQLYVDLKTITTKNKIFKEIERNDIEVKMLHQEREEVEGRIKSITASQAELLQKLAENNKKLADAERKFLKEKGNLFARREEVSSIKNKEEIQKKEIETQIYDRVSGYLPLMIVKDFVAQALGSIEAQEIYKKEIQEIKGVEKFLLQVGEIPKNIVSAFNDKKQRIEKELRVENDVFNASVLAIEQARFLVACDETLEMQKMQDLFAQGDATASSVVVDTLYLETEVNSKEIQSLVDKIVSLNKTIGKLESDEEKLASEIHGLKKKGEGIERQLNDIMLKYIDSGETEDNAKRLLSYSVKIKKILSRYKQAVQGMKVSMLSEIVTKKFKKIIGKKSLVNEIVFDKGTLVMSLFCGDKQQIFNRQLSAGEKQLLSTAIIWGIIECSRQNFPMIIDTPLARLDHVHRELFAKNYLPKAGQQVVIFSTDAEITGKIEEKLEKYIARKYLLDYNEEGRYTKIVAGRYF